MRIRAAYVLFAIICLYKPSNSLAQNGRGLDAVFVSKNYYNSIVKILLYDSAAAKINPDLAYIGRGSGFFVSDDGYIFTNRHVIDYCRGYCRYTTYNKEEKKEEPNIDVYSTALLSDPSLVKINYVGRTSVIVQVYNSSSGSSYNLYHAQVIVIDTANFDGAILKIVSDMKGNPVTEKFHPVPIGNSDSTEQGQDLCLYGFPAQVNGSFDVMLKDLSTLMFGKHSGLDINVNTQYGFIKTDATINNGNSGGPVFGPSNNVIGIATAAFEKTNLGLVGGINDMYDLVALIPELKKELTSRGLVPPQHKPVKSTAVLFKPQVLPSGKALNKINSIKTGRKASNSVGLSFGFFYQLPHNETHSIDDYTNLTPAGANVSTTSNGGKSYKIPTSGYGASARLTSPNIFKNQDKNIVAGFFRMDLGQSVLNWNSPNLYTTPYPTSFQMNSNIKTSYFEMVLGLQYSRALSNGAVIGVYYGFGMSTVDISEVSFGIATSVGQTANITYRSSNVILPQLFGLNIMYKSFFADLGYSFFTEKLDYTLPYDYYKGVFYTDYFVSGKIQRNPIYLTLGYSFFFYPKKH